MVQMRGAGISNFRRDAWLEINLANLQYNLEYIYTEIERPLIPALKADAYGHGAVVLSNILDAYDYIKAYAVASVDEALQLKAECQKDVMVLGICPNWSFETAIEQGVELTIVDLVSAQELNQLAKLLGKKAKVHIKIDSGMNRIGFQTSKLESSYREISELLKLEMLEVKSLYSHLVDPGNQALTLRQNSSFIELTQDFDIPKHIASSKAGALYPEIKHDYVRCGIELYGLENSRLKRLMSLYARIGFIKEISAGESVSYLQSWISDKDTRIGTLPLGYADGIPRILSNKIKASIKNTSEEITQVGNITMDQMMFNLGSNPDIKIGDVVELIGDKHKLSTWAEEAQTITYELVTSLNLRLPKTYSR